MASLEGVVRLTSVGTKTRVAFALEWVRERVTTTPGRLGIISALVVAGAACVGVIATSAERSRASAAQAASSRTEPLLVQAVNLYSALSDADATVTTTFRRGGLESPELRARYRRDLLLGSDSLSILAREATSPVERRAVRTVGRQLPVYSGLVEAARANNRQGLPIGAAYLRQAGALLRSTILPQADQLYASEARRLSRNYDTGTATAALVILVIAVAVALGLFGLTQVYVARISRRILNLPMLLATVVLLGVSIWALVGLIGEQNALAIARSHGSDQVEVLSAARVLVSRAQSDESLTLVSRGSDETDPVDFARVMRVLSPPSGLIGEIARLARRTATTGAANQLEAQFKIFASSPRSSSTTPIDTNLEGQIAGAQKRFAAAAADATSSLSRLSLAIPLLTLLATVLALTGLLQRLEEYR